MLDVLVIAVLFGLLLFAAVKEFPAYTNRTTNPATPSGVPDPAASTAGQ